MNDGLSTHRNYEMVEKCLKQECTIKQIIKLTKIKETTVYRIINALLEDDAIVNTRWVLENKDSRKAERVFKVKK